MARTTILMLAALLVFTANLPAGEAAAPPAGKTPEPDVEEKPPEKTETLEEALLQIAENAKPGDIEMWGELSNSVMDIDKSLRADSATEELFEPGGPAARITYIRDRGARFCLAAALQIDNLMSDRVRAVIVRLAGPAVKKDDKTAFTELSTFLVSKEPALALAAFDVLGEKGFDLKNVPLAMLASDDAGVVCAAARYLLEQGSKDGVEVLTARIGKAADSADAAPFEKFNSALREITGALAGSDPGQAVDAQSRKAAAESWKKWWTANAEKKPSDWLLDGYNSAKALAVSAEPGDVGRGLSHFACIGPKLDDKTRKEAGSICLRLGLLDFNLRWLRARAMFALGDPNAPDFTVALFRKGIPDDVMRKMISYLATDTPMLQDIFRMLKGREHFIKPGTGADMLASRYLFEHHAWQAVPLLVMCLRGKDAEIRRRALRMVENHFEPFSPVPWRDAAKEEKLAQAVAKWLEGNFEPGGFIWYKPTWKWLPKKVPFVPGFEPPKKDGGAKKAGAEEEKKEKKEPENK